MFPPPHPQPSLRPYPDLQLVDGATADLSGWSVSLQPVANAAWKGRAVDGTVPEPEPEAPAAGVSITDLVSILTLILGTVAGMVGAALWLHPAASLVVLWLSCMPVALLIGWGDRS